MLVALLVCMCCCCRGERVDTGSLNTECDCCDERASVRGDTAFGAAAMVNNLFSASNCFTLQSKNNDLKN